MRKIGFIFWMFLAFVSCERDTEQSPVNPPFVNEASDVIVLNEGNFMWGNSSISIIHTATETVSQQVFNSANNFPLGDVAQSAIKYGDLLYVVVNNSSKIEVVNAISFKSVNTISGFNSPRYLCIVNETPLIAWVSDLYSDEISEINLESGNKLRTIPMEGWTEKMIDLGNEVLVHNITDSALYLVNKVSGNSKVLNTINGEKVMDITSNERYAGILTNIGIWTMNIENRTLIKNHEFTEDYGLRSIAMNWKNDIAYLKGADIVKVDLNSKTETSFYEGNGKALYGMAFNARTNQIFVTDAKDYVQKGDVIVINSDKSIAYTLEAGVIPQFLLMP